MIAAILHWLDRQRRQVLAVALSLFAVALFCTSRLEISDAPERWMPRTTLAAWQVFEEHFDAGDNLGVALHFRRPITDDDLPRLRSLRQKLAAIEGIRQVYDTSLVAEEIEQVSLTELLNPANAARFDVYNGALWDNPEPGDPTRTLMIVCELEFYAGEDQSNADGLNARRRHVAEEVEAIVAEQQALPQWRDVDFHVASSITIMREIEKRTRAIAYTFLPASILIGLFSLLIGFRSGSALAVAVLGSIWAMVLVLGCVGALGGTLGVVTVGTPALMSVIAIASTVHFAAHEHEAHDHHEPETFAAAVPHSPGHDPQAAHARRRRWQLVRWVAVPCFGSALATGIGFLMLCYNELEPIRELGFQMFAGALLAFFGVFIATQVLPIRRTYPGRWLTEANLKAFARAVTARPKAMVVLFTVVVSTLTFLAWPRPKSESIGLYVDADPFSFFSADQPIKRALDHFEERQFAVYQLEVILVPKEPAPAPAAPTASTKAYEANVAAARKFITQMQDRSDLGVIRVLSTVSFRDRYHELIRQFTTGEQGASPGVSAARLANAAALYQTFQAWNRDKLNEGALRVTLVALNGPAGFAPLVRYVEQRLPTERFDCYLAGSVKQNVDLADGLGHGMLYGLTSSFLAMAVVCAVLFRSVWLATLAVVPNMFPILFVFGVMGAFKIPISSGTAMVATIAMGIALNDTIHFMLHYRMRTRVEGRSAHEAIQLTIASIGRPVVWTSLVHIAGFAIFLATDFIPLFQFGLFASLAMFTALIGDVVLLPNLLLVFDRAARRTTTTAPEAVALHENAD